MQKEGNKQYVPRCLGSLCPERGCHSSHTDGKDVGWLFCIFQTIRLKKTHNSFISRDSVGGSLLHGVGWHKGSWKMQMSSFIRRGAGADCWLAVPSCETSRGHLHDLTQPGSWGLRWCTLSPEVKAADLLWQSPGS